MEILQLRSSWIAHLMGEWHRRGNSLSLKELSKNSATQLPDLGLPTRSWRRTFMAVLHWADERQSVEHRFLSMCIPST